jgi:Flp pilus assembly protein TadD
VKRLMTVLLCAGITAVAVVPAHASLKVAATPVTAAEAVDGSVDSLEVLAQAVAKDSTRFDDLSALGILYLERDKAEEAITVLQRAHDLRPEDRKVLVNLGAAMDATGRQTRAQKYYRQVLDAFPGDSVASCRLATSLYSEGNVAESVKLLDQLIHSSPRAPCAYFSMGVAFADAGIYRDAMRMWRKVVELAPASPEGISAKESLEVLEKFVGR